MKKRIQVKAKIGNDAYKTEITAGNKIIITDEPLDKGGKDLGPTPTELLAASLASCTAITLRMYVARKGWNTGEITVQVSIDKDENNTNVFNRKIATEFALEEAPTNRIIAIANACPVHKMLSGEVAIQTSIVNQ